MNLLKRDFKNEDWSHNPVENKGQVFHRRPLPHNLHENKAVSSEFHNVIDNKGVSSEGKA
jgi:hypothetical protein